MQGIYLDTDGTLLNSNTLAPSLLPADVPTGAGATLHSAMGNQLFNPSECAYVNTTGASNDGAWCSPALTFRRMMVRRRERPSNQYCPGHQQSSDRSGTSMLTSCRTGI